ncbi:hypothetical protein [Aureimonas leprariae]|uniref:Uncharacterized protein n=1 Tax=Plantimonas leprariae TaxID=2615207 RepID=A0A7V7PSI8_9HYPH|nr:hypothetical protein [Aureimonas leprariae]KAB0682066.1 hypothetical protein F6X38_04505 [Aureimonas leprariae]
MITETVYRSSNGDDWQLEREASGAATVVHRANPGSGGKITRMPVDEFLDRHSDGSPESQDVREALARSPDR